MSDAQHASRHDVMLGRAIEHAKRIKVDHVRQVHGKPGRTDILTAVLGFRGTLPVVSVHHRPHRDLMLYLADVIASAMAVDYLAITNESWSGRDLTNPVTGKQWEPGEMQDVVENHRGLEKGWVREGLLLNVVGRDGAYASATVPYLIEGRRVTWLDGETRSTDEYQMSGTVPDRLRQAMSRPTILAIVANETGSTPLDTDDPVAYETQQAALDCAAVKFIRSNVDEAVPDNPGALFFQLISQPDAITRRAYIEESFDDDPDVIAARDLLN